MAKKRERKTQSLASKGGTARAAALSPEERSAIARKASLARWGKEISKATHIGNLELGTETIPCAVLQDETRVLSERGVTKALGGKRGGSHWQRMREVKLEGGAKLPVYLSANNLKAFIDLELALALSSPIRYMIPGGGGMAYGLDAKLLPAICTVFLNARDAGKLTKPQERLAASADILVRGLAQVGVIALVDEATGFQEDRERRALAKILEAFVAKELRPWIPTFPADYYRQLYRLRGLEYPPRGNKMPRYFGKLTNDIVYERLAPGVLDELRRISPRDNKGRLKHHFHRRLTDGIGHPKLSQHLGAVVAVMKFVDDGDYDGFIGLLNKHYPKQGELPLLDMKWKQDASNHA